ncbi:MAG: hypothetical protein MI807_04045 [Verrucomicrobiales bacterium]|nr:hypothetical protein [Verrucomicrobiales bacterium]
MLEIPHTSQEASDSVMGTVLRQFAANYPDYCDSSGRAFWPVPAYFPLLLSRVLDALQQEISSAYIHGENEKARLLAEARIKLAQITLEGDLGENHTEMFLRDHPNVTTADAENRPFDRFCAGAMAVEDPVELLGLLCRNEQGSIEEMEAARDCQLLADGPFLQVHLIEEEEHRKLAEEIRDIMMTNSVFAASFKRGEEVHDKLYAGVLEFAAQGAN